MFANNRISIFAAFAFASLPITAQAKDDACNKFLPPNLAVGEYTLKMMPGTMTAMGMTMAYPRVETMTATVKKEGGWYVLTSTHGLNMKFNDENTNHREWWPQDNLATALDLKQTDIMLCQTIENLPRLFANGSGSYFAENGSEVPTEMDMLVYDVTDKGISASGIMHAVAKAEGQTIVFNLKIELTPK